MDDGRKQFRVTCLLPSGLHLDINHLQEKRKYMAFKTSMPQKPHPKHEKSGWQTWAMALLLAAATALAYSNTLHAPFEFDDGSNIVENPHIRMTSL
ncbi:MAG: hypothetical protein B5M56_06635, partial [Desulfococcus sp. 4484_241]